MGSCSSEGKRKVDQSKQLVLAEFEENVGKINKLVLALYPKLQINS